MHVRPVEPEDFEAVCELLAELGRPAVTDSSREECRSVFMADVIADDADHLIAEADGRPVGFCSLHYRTRLNHDTREAWVPDLIVTEAGRGTGAGRTLLAEAERRARARGCHALTLESGHQRERAHAFYKAAGMSQPGLSFFKKLR